MSKILKTIDELDIYQLTAYHLHLEKQKRALDESIYEVGGVIYKKLNDDGLLVKDLSPYRGRDLKGLTAFTEDGHMIPLNLDNLVVWVDESGRMRAEGAEGSVSYNHQLQTYILTSKDGDVDVGDISFLKMGEA